MPNRVNPIAWVGNSSTTIPAPSSYTWNMQDVSDPDTGRTEDGKMYKKKIGSTVALNMEWQNIPTEDAKKVLDAFSKSEYFNVRYLDPLAGTFVTREFYVGDRSAPIYNATLGLWSGVSFNIIGRNVNGT